MGAPSYGIYTFHESENDTNSMYFRRFDGQSWSADTQLQNPHTNGTITLTESSGCGVVFEGVLWCFYRHNGQLGFNVNSGVWQNGLPVPVAMTGTPSAAIWQNRIYVFYQGAGGNPDGGDGRLHFVTTDGNTFSGDQLVPIRSEEHTSELQSLV